MTIEYAIRILDPETSRDALWKYEDKEDRLKVFNEACRVAVDALRAQYDDPLTLEELREMDGEPVWCVDGYENACWCLVNCDDGLPCCYDNETGLWYGGFYGMTGAGKHGLHQTGWLAYRRKPEEETT